MVILKFNEFSWRFIEKRKLLPFSTPKWLKIKEFLIVYTYLFKKCKTTSAQRASARGFTQQRNGNASSRDWSKYVRKLSTELKEKEFLDKQIQAIQSADFRASINKSSIPNNDPCWWSSWCSLVLCKTEINFTFCFV